MSDTPVLNFWVNTLLFKVLINFVPIQEKFVIQLEDEFKMNAALMSFHLKDEMKSTIIFWYG